MLPVVTFTGPHNSGKTTLVRRVVALLRDRGWKVGVIKSTKHRDLFPEPPGKDTALYRGDGVEEVVVLEPGRAIHFWEGSPRVEEVVFSLLGRVDLVMGEGFKSSSLPKIEVVATPSQLAQLRERENLLAVVWKEPVEGVKTFHPDKVEALARFLEGTFLGAPWASLKVDGEDVPMKPFVERLVASTVAALVGNLKGGKGGKIELVVRWSEEPGEEEKGGNEHGG